MALESGPSGAKVQNGVIVVSHEATRTGAPLTALNIARELGQARGIPVITILLKTGELESEFASIGPVFVAPEPRPYSHRNDPRRWARAVKGAIHFAKSTRQGSDDWFWRRVGKHIASRQIQYAICNSVLSGGAALRLKQAGVRSIGLVHEMPHSIRIFGWAEQCKALIRGADALVFACPQVQEAFAQSFATDGAVCKVFPQGCNLDVDRFAPELRAASRAAFRTNLGLTTDDVLVLGAGYGDFRKGIDLFAETARGMATSGFPASGRIVFAWVGRVEPRFRNWITKDIAELNLCRRLIFLDNQKDMVPCFAAADIFFLPSREDPFPNVVLEAMASGIPVVGFAGSGGFEEQARGGAGVAVAYGDIAAALKILDQLAGNPDERTKTGQRGREKIASWGGHHAYVGNLMNLLEASPENSLNPKSAFDSEPTS